MGLSPIKITSREYDVLIRLTKSNKEIAEDLGLSIGTINKHYYKLGARFDAYNRTSIVLKALNFGIVDLAEFIL